MEFGKTCQFLFYTSSIPEKWHRWKSRSTSESGLDGRWWSDSMECYTYLRNVTDLLSDGKTPYDRRFGEPFKGPIILFGALVENHPISQRDQARIHQFGETASPGIFLGSELVAGWIWKGFSASRPGRFGKVGCIRHLSSKNQRERNIDQTKSSHKGEEFKFPVADGTAKMSGRDYEFREPTLRRSEDLSGELQGASGEFQPADTADDAEAPPIFGRYKVTSSVVITMNLGFNSSCRRKKHSLFH